MTDEELAEYYSALLIIQYAGKPKAQATIIALADAVIASQIISQVNAGFGLDTALGAQLDIIGKYIGVTRNLYGLILSKSFFAMIPGHSGSGGWPTYKGFALASQAPDIGWYFIRATDVSTLSYILSDAEFQTLLEYVAALNSLDMTYENIDNFLYEFFSQYVTLAETGTMEITYTHDSTDPSNLYTFVNYVGLLPHPAGVNVIS